MPSHEFWRKNFTNLVRKVDKLDSGETKSKNPNYDFSVALARHLVQTHPKLSLLPTPQKKAFVEALANWEHVHFKIQQAGLPVSSLADFVPKLFAKPHSEARISKTALYSKIGLPQEVFDLEQTILAIQALVEESGAQENLFTINNHIRKIGAEVRRRLSPEERN